VVVEVVEPGLLSHMLTLAGTAAPKLQTLVMYGEEGSVDLGGPEVQSLVSLTQLKRLELGSWRFPDPSIVLEIGILTALHSLEVSQIWTSRMPR